MAAQGVDLVDARAAGQQRGGESAQVGQGNAGRRGRHQRRAAAGDEANQQIVFVESARQFEGFFPGAQAVPVRDGMTAGLEVESARGVDRSLFWNEQAAGRTVREQVRQGQGHGLGSLPQPEDANPPGLIQRIFPPVDDQRIPRALDEAADGRARLDSLDGRVKNAGDGCAARVAHKGVGGK